MRSLMGIRKNKALKAVFVLVCNIVMVWKISMG